MAGTRYYEDPTGFFRNLEIPVDDATARALEERECEEVEVVLDAAVGRGVIASAERARWRRFMRKEPQVIRETLEALPGRPEAAERALTEDSRIRSLDEQFARYSGIEARDREYAGEPPLSLEDAWLRYCGISET